MKCYIGVQPPSWRNARFPSIFADQANLKTGDYRRKWGDGRGDNWAAVKVKRTLQIHLTRTRLKMPFDPGAFLKSFSLTIISNCITPKNPVQYFPHSIPSGAARHHNCGRSAAGYRYFPASFAPDAHKPAGKPCRYPDPISHRHLG
jgi:hypothetical protein